MKLKKFGGKNQNLKNKKIKKEKTKREIRFSRTKTQKYVALTVFLIICASLFFNAVFFSKYQTIRNSVKAGETKIEERLNQVDEMDVSYSDSVVTFGEDFLRTYYNIPAEKEDREARLESIKDYFVVGFNTSNLESIDDFNGSRKLNNMRYVETEYLDSNKMNLYFRVNYEITEISIEEKTIEKEVEDKDDKDKKKKVTEVVKEEVPTTVTDSVEVVVPIITDGEGYAVMQSPSLTNRELKASIEVEDTAPIGGEVSSTERENIETFLNDFFTSYGVSDEKLPFMSSVEKGLNGKIFTGANLQNVSLVDEEYHVLVDVIYQNEETTFNSMYTYYLVASKEKNNYFIEEIKQGGF